MEWTVESEVVQAAELLEQWRKRSPIEVSDALKLLGMNVPFQTGLVRIIIPLHYFRTKLLSNLTFSIILGSSICD